MYENTKKYQWEQQKRIKKNKKNKNIIFYKIFYFMQKELFYIKKIILFQKELFYKIFYVKRFFLFYVRRKV